MLEEMHPMYSLLTDLSDVIRFALLYTTGSRFEREKKKGAGDFPPPS